LAPAWKVNFSFRSIDLGFAKGDREAHWSIQQQVVICEVVHVAEIGIHIHADLPHQPLRQAKFVVVPCDGVTGRRSTFGFRTATSEELDSRIFSKAGVWKTRS